MNRTFLLALTAIVCLAFAGSAMANQVIEGGTLAVPIEYEWGWTEDLVIIGTGSLAPDGNTPDGNQGNLAGHAWLGGPDAVVSVELAIGKPGFDRDTETGYIWALHAMGSLIFREDNAFGFKTTADLSIPGDLNIGGGSVGRGQLFIPLGSASVGGDVNVGIGHEAIGTIHVQGGSFAIGATSTMKLGDSEDPTTTGVVPIGEGIINISGGSLTAPTGSSVIVGALGEGRLAVLGSAITAIDLASVEVSERGVVAFSIDSGVHSPTVKPISSTGNFYLADGSIIDLDFTESLAETQLSNYDEAATERVVDLITSTDLKWNETGYNVALSPEDEPGWDLQVTGNTLQAVYFGGTGDDLIINTGTELAPTAIAADLYRNIFVGYGTETTSFIVAEGHASVNADVACSSDMTIARGDSCDGSVTIGTDGKLSIFAGGMSLAAGSGADAKINLEDNGELYVMYSIQLGDSVDSQTLVTGSAELNISGSAKLEAEDIMVGNYEQAGPGSTVTQTGGTVTLRDNLFIGHNGDAGAEGSSYTISGDASLSVAGELQVGYTNKDSSIASSFNIESADATVLAGNLRVATYCTLKFTVDAGPNYTGAVTPIDMSDPDVTSFAYFTGQYIGDAVDPDNCAIIDMAFAPGAESLIAMAPITSDSRGLDIILIQSHWNLKWQATDTAYGEGGTIIDHVYGFKFAGATWGISEILLGSNDRRGEYASLRLHYLGDQTAAPQPTADAGADQTGLIAREIVTLDASGSSLTPGREMTGYEWSWTVGSDVYTITDTDPIAEAYFPVGTHTVTLTVTSDIGETDTDTCVVSIPSPRRPGDVNGDGTTNLTDFVDLRNHFGQCDDDI